MKQVTKETLKEASKKLLFEMSEEQYDTLLEEFQTILKQMEYISKIPGVDNVQPMSFPFDVTNNYLREDIPSKQLSREVALSNSGDVVEGQIRLPKVVG